MSSISRATARSSTRRSRSGCETACCRLCDAFSTSGTKIALEKGMEDRMLSYAWIFLVIAIIAAIFGFGGIAAASAGIAKLLFYIFLAIFIITLLLGRRRI